MTQECIYTLNKVEDQAVLSDVVPLEAAFLPGYLEREKKKNGGNP